MLHYSGLIGPTPCSLLTLPRSGIFDSPLFIHYQWDIRSIYRSWLNYWTLNCETNGLWQNISAMKRERPETLLRISLMLLMFLSIKLSKIYCEVFQFACQHNALSKWLTLLLASNICMYKDLLEPQGYTGL